MQPQGRWLVLKGIGTERARKARKAKERNPHLSQSRRGRGEKDPFKFRTKTICSLFPLRLCDLERAYASGREDCAFLSLTKFTRLRRGLPAFGGSLSGGTSAV